MPRPPKNPTGRTFVTRCKFEWVCVADDLHDCGQHGEHTEHVCSNDNCDERVPVSVAGGRYRGNQKKEEVAA